MRTACPASSLFFGWVRLPFTRTSPLRMMRWMWLNERPGNRASKKRSTRMPVSSGVTLTVCTPAEKCTGLGAATGGGAIAGASRDGRAGKAGRAPPRLAERLPVRFTGKSDWRGLYFSLERSLLRSSRSRP